jgi:hypothetical protein
MKPSITWCFFMALAISEVAGILTGCCRTQPRETLTRNGAIDYQVLTRRLQGTIISHETSLDELDEAISRLGSLAENTTFWTRIANDSSYSLPHRSKCIFALFRRHGLLGGCISLLAERLARPTWLRDEDIEEITVITGWIPVGTSPDCTVFRLKVLSDTYSIYLKVLGTDIDRAQLSRVLRQNSFWQSGMKDALIMQIGLFDEFTELRIRGGRDYQPATLQDRVGQ